VGLESIKGRPEPAFLVYLVGGAVRFVFGIWVRALPAGSGRPTKEGCSPRTVTGGMSDRVLNIKKYQ